MQEKKIVLKVFGLGVIKGYLIIVYNTQVDNPFQPVHGRVQKKYIKRQFVLRNKSTAVVPELMSVVINIKAKTFS